MRTTAFDVDLCNTFNPLKTRRQKPIGIVIECRHLEVGIISLQKQICDRVVARGIGHVDDGPVDVFGILRNFIDLIGHFLQDAFGRRTNIELQCDLSAAQAGY